CWIPRHVVRIARPGDRAGGYGTSAQCGDAEGSPDTLAVVGRGKCLQQGTEIIAAKNAVHEIVRLVTAAELKIEVTYYDGPHANLSRFLRRVDIGGRQACRIGARPAVRGGRERRHVTGNATALYGQRNVASQRHIVRQFEENEVAALGHPHL